jgi:adenylate cyclase class 2
MANPVEREVKLRYPNPTDARAAILRAGAVSWRPRRLQSDRLLDRKTEPLQNRRCTLRVRVDGDRAFVTFKGPPQPGTMKVREELETSVGDGTVLLRVCEQLGFHVWFRYEKYREEFTRGDLVIALDESPIGTFVELEGSRDDILRMADDLERPPTDFVLDSYHALFETHRAEHGSLAQHMVFDAP